MSKKEQSQTLYRKYRPSKFDEVIGQEHIVSVLQNALSKNSISHAYLFHGGRGTGKTSVARILAKELGTTLNDLYEIDAASNRGIDDIRELREGVRTVPFESKYKVYIIDEAHMLTKEAWNALLKTLEEPPAHAIFVLATTELHKVPDTIISRSEVYTFKEPTSTTLKDVVKDVATKEGYIIDSGTAELIALLGEGSFRDTLSILQKVVSGIENNKILEDDVERLLGTPKKSLIREFVEVFIKKDSKKSLDVFRRSRELGIDTKLFLKLVLHMIRLGLLLKISSTSKEFVSNHASREDVDFLINLVDRYKKEFNSKTLDALLKAYSTVAISPIPELPVEMAISELE